MLPGARERRKYTCMLFSNRRFIINDSKGISILIHFSSQLCRMMAIKIRYVVKKAFKRKKIE